MLRSLPSVDSLVLRIADVPLIHSVKVRLAQRVIAQHRKLIETTPESAILEVLERDLRDLALTPCSFKPMINATGVVLHTNLGRAPLGKEVLSELTSQMQGYCSLEFEDGLRSSRTRQIERLLSLLTGAEAAIVVNNNAAALFLALHTLAAQSEVVISRGELVQIGGGFRIPDILTSAGAWLKEVGTTNITEMNDYRNALNDRTALILKINPSNFVVSGFCDSVSIPDLATLCSEKNVPLCFDEGSGDLKNVSNAVKHCDLIMFSGDKLLGGPQAGVIVGKRSLVSALREAPLYRALRMGKLDLFCLEWTLHRLLSGKTSLTQDMLEISGECLKKRVLNFAKTLNVKHDVVMGKSSVGGGSQPGVELETWLIAIGGDEQKLAAKLLDRNVVVRKDKGEILIDLRTVLDGEENNLSEAIRKCLS